MGLILDRHGRIVSVLGTVCFIVYICYMHGRLCNRAPLPQFAWEGAWVSDGGWGVCLCGVGWGCLTGWIYCIHLYYTLSTGRTLAFVYLREWECSGMVSRHGELNVRECVFCRKHADTFLPSSFFLYVWEVNCDSMLFFKSALVILCFGHTSSPISSGYSMLSWN